MLQDLLLKWQHFAEEQHKFSDWLAQKEAVLGHMIKCDLSDPDTVIKQVKDLKVSWSIYMYWYPESVCLSVCGINADIDHNYWTI